MAAVNTSHMVCSTLRLCFVLETPSGPKLHITDTVLLSLHAICFLDILIRFNIGYKCNDINIVLNRRRFIWYYLSGWFTIDLVSCLPVAYVLLHTKIYSYRYLLFGHLMAILRALRLPTVLRNLNNFMQIFTQSYIWHRTVRHAVYFFISVHWCNCVMYLLPALGYYWNGKMPKHYALFMKPTGGDLSKFSTALRYEKALFITLSVLVGVNPSMLRVSTVEEFVVYSVVVIYGAMFMIYTEVFLLKIYMTGYNSLTRYHGLMSQIEAYMQHKQLPVPLKKRLREFYRYRYREDYKEDDTLDCLSDQLRREVTLHTCHQLVNRLPLLEGMSASVVGPVLGCLRPELYLPNDLVLRAGDIGYCMYFIANGTVAVYSLNGAEVCHLVDCEHFGEVALLMSDRKRIATVVAVEITRVYRLDAEDFRQFVKPNEVLYDRLQVMASQRIHETALLDDDYCRKREKHIETSTLTDKLSAN